jgi:general secretion pathway protein F
MPVFEYKAFNQTGRKIKGVIESDTVRSARLKLKQQGIFPTDLSESRVRPQTSTFDLRLKRVSTTQLAVMTRQLATLVGAGMPLVEALRALSDQIDEQRLRQVVAEVGDRVNEGLTMAEAMRTYPKVFPRLYVHMDASAEASGSLDLVLERLAELLEGQAVLRRKVLSALTYPILMLLLCLGVVVLLLSYIVPQITVMFEDRKALLPLPTRIIIALSNFLQGYWWVLVIVGAFAVVLFQRYRTTVKGREALDRLKLRLPIFGGITRKVAMSRFSRNLGSLLASGVEVLTALGIVRNIVGNVVLEKIIADAIVGVREGKNLAAELSHGGEFPRMLIHMIAIGEQTGQLEQMLQRAATNYETEVSAMLTALTSILEPLLIVFLAAIVGTILAAVMLPMLEMTSLGV